MESVDDFQLLTVYILVYSYILYNLLHSPHEVQESGSLRGKHCVLCMG